MLLDINNQIMKSEVNTGSKKIVVPDNIWNQDKAHPSRSDKYVVVNSRKVCEMFAEKGYTSTLISKEKVKKPGYKGFETHLICIENLNHSFRNKVLDKEVRPRLYFKNSYHGRTTWNFDFGLIRFYCLNGLVLGSIFESTKTRHIGIEINEVEAIIHQLEGSMSRMNDYLQSLKESQMTLEQQMYFAELAFKKRFSSNEKFVRADYSKLLTARREEDRSDSVWTVLNRIQENLGLNYRDPENDLFYTYEEEDENGNKTLEERKVMRLTNIKEVTNMNKFLFDQAAEFVPSKELQLMAA